MKGRAAMTNFEKYEDKALEVWLKSADARDYIIIPGVVRVFWDWLCSLAKLELTEEERKIAEALQVLGFEWLARDKDGMLIGYEEEPEKDKLDWYVDELNGITISPSVFSGKFPSICWEDTEPTKISDLLNQK